MPSCINKLIGGILLLSIFLGQIQVFNLSRAVYSLNFEQGKDIIWEVTYIDYVLVQNLIDEGVLKESFLKKEIGQQRKYWIEDIQSQSDRWKILFHIYDGTNLENSKGTELGNGWHKNVAKDPSDAAPNWATADSLFTNYFIPLSISEYLAELVLYIGKSNITSSGSSLIYDNSVNGRNDMKILTYNNYGVRQNYSLYYKGSLAYRYDMVYYGESYFDLNLQNSMLFIGITIFFSAIIILGLGFIYLVTHKKRTNYRQNNIS